MKAKALLAASLALSQVAWTQYFTSKGAPVRWAKGEIVVKVDEKGTEDVPGDLEFEALDRSMGTWNQVSCPHPMLLDGGRTSKVKPGPNNGVNLVIWVSDPKEWSTPELAHVIALTTLYYDDSNGIAAKFDMEFADFDYDFTVTDGPLRKTDVQNTATHEFGHVLGLDHSADPEATMYFSAQPGDISKRSLSPDDIEGLCTIYSDWSVEERPSVVEGGLVAEEAPSSPHSGGGCTAGGPRDPGPALFLAFLPFLAFWRRSWMPFFVAFFGSGFAPIKTDSGVPVHWDGSEVLLSLDRQGTSDIAGEEEHEALKTAMAVWNQVPCNQPSLVPGPLVDLERPLDLNALPYGIVTFEAIPDQKALLGLTLLDFDASTGRLLGATVIFNDARLFTVSSDHVKIDLPSVAVHEFGHVLGLGHSSHVKATMFPIYYDGTTFQRDPHQDDAQGLCAIYGGQLPADWAPVWPWKDSEGAIECQDSCEAYESSMPTIFVQYPGYDIKGRRGCSASPYHGGALWALFLLGGLLFLFRRKGGLRRPFLFAIVIAQMAYVSNAVGDEDPLKVEVRSRVLLGLEKPALILEAQEVLKDVEVEISLDGKKATRARLGTLRPSARKEVTFEAPVGESHAEATITYKGAKEALMIAFEVVVGRPMEVSIGEGDVDLEGGHVTFSASEAVAKVQLLFYGADGKEVSAFEKEVTSEPKKRIEIAFEPPKEPISRLVLRAYDFYGFYNGVEITPYFIEIPHEEVQFEFGRADIVPKEEPKLERTLARIREAMAKVAKEFKARLYVAGYTDTVGSKEYNLELSRRRAEAIGRWFRAHGLKIPICFQGFGEDALAVPTPDETEEPRNRRTIHVLANQPPPTSKVFPRSDWTCF